LIIAVHGERIVERFKPIPQLAAAIERARRPGDAVAIDGVSGGNALVYYTRPPVALDTRLAICSARRVFVVSSKKRPDPDPTYGRARRVLATSNNDILILYDGPQCR
jgi:hypothetical protein